MLEKIPYKIHQYYMQKADEQKCHSDDKDIQTCAVIVRFTFRGKLLEYLPAWLWDWQIKSAGSNTLTRGTEATEENTTRPNKVGWIEHAERNAIFKAVSKGIKLRGAVMYLRWFPCVDCMRAIIQSGISAICVDEIPGEEDFKHPRYGEGWKIAIEIAKNAKLEILKMNIVPRK